jgi:hypothetical protein
MPILSCAIKAIMANVFPEPILSAIIPPRKSGGAAYWKDLLTLLMYSLHDDQKTDCVD